MLEHTKRRQRIKSGQDAVQHKKLLSPLIPQGGRLKPLMDNEVQDIIDHALAILDQIGMAEAPPWLEKQLLERGAKISENGRVVFPKSIVEKTIRHSPSVVSLPGYIEDRGLDIGGGRVHIGTGGAAVEVLDSKNSNYRASTLNDLYHLMRIVDQSQHIHYGVRPVVARDMLSPLDLDINTAFACLKACGKPIGVSFDNADHVAPVIDMFDMALGKGGGFREQPFCMAIIVHAVSPLRFAAEGVEIMKSAIRLGMPLQICTAAQAGATSPASLAAST